MVSRIQTRNELCLTIMTTEPLGVRPRQSKRCPKCGEEDLSKFGKNESRHDGLQVYCRPCQNGIRSERWQTLPQEERASQQRNWNQHEKYHRYNITTEKYQAMFDAQGGVCAICKRPPNEVGWLGLAIDHDHSCCSGKRSCGKCVRGLLCHSCNVGLGYFQDSVTVLEFAIEYLKGAGLSNSLSREGILTA